MKSRPASGDRGKTPRSWGRELALRYLYALDIAGADLVESFDSFAASQKEQGAAVAFARELVSGVKACWQEIDELLGGLAANWSLKRMAVVDRNILRLGCYELLHRAEIPGKVTLNEAVELAKRYSTATSGSFVNGILDQVMQQEERNAL